MEAGARVLAVEVDADLIPVLNDRFDDCDDARVIHGDVLADKHTINADVIEGVNDWLMGGSAGGFKLIANLPYQIASPLLVNMALDHVGMSMAVVMIQREVADRLAARPGAKGKAYGPLGIIIQAMCEVERLFTLPPSCFWPAPKVESSVVRLTRRAKPMTEDPHGFAKFVHRVFQSRRKQIGAALGKGIVLPAGIERTMRAEELTVAELVELAEGVDGGESDELGG